MQVRVEPYSHKEHREQVERWWRLHGVAPVEPGFLSDEGFIVPGIAAGWLYLTNSKMALIENLTANPEVDEATRSEAIDRVVRRIVDEAQDFGAKVICGFTQIPAVIGRAERLGFQKNKGVYVLVSKGI
jgi:hypothetical protein